MNAMSQLSRFFLLAVFVLFGYSCGNSGKKSKERIKIDGSSTVYPVSEAIAEEYRSVKPRSRVEIGVSGTGGGFKKFCRNETDINDASRPIKESEIAECKKNNVTWKKITIGFDGLSVVVNKKNDWLEGITLEELKKIWEPDAEGKIMKWSDVNPDWPNEEIHLFGPGTASGTYDFFTESVMGKSGMSRGDFTASEDDNVLVKGSRA